MKKLNLDPKKLQQIAVKNHCSIEEAEKRVARLVQNTTISVSNAIKFLLAAPSSNQYNSKY